MKTACIVAAALCALLVPAPLLSAPLITAEAPAKTDAEANLPKEVEAYARSLGKQMYLNGVAFADDDVTDNNGVSVNRDVDDALADITDHAGIKKSFIPIRSNVQNALAYMYNGQRMLYYNVNFIKMAHDDIDPDWAVISILAHEVGHHLLGHIFVIDSNFKQRELEADEFSGFIMYRMGASLDEALVTMRTLGPEQETPSHPEKGARLAAIEHGWHEAEAITAHEGDMARRRDARQKLHPKTAAAFRTGY
eukprot:gene15202-15346_t